MGCFSNNILEGQDVAFLSKRSATSNVRLKSFWQAPIFCHFSWFRSIFLVKSMLKQSLCNIISSIGYYLSWNKVWICDMLSLLRFYWKQVGRLPDSQWTQLTKTWIGTGSQITVTLRAQPNSAVNLLTIVCSQGIEHPLGTKLTHLPTPMISFNINR